MLMGWHNKDEAASCWNKKRCDSLFVPDEVKEIFVMMLKGKEK